MRRNRISSGLRFAIILMALDAFCIFGVAQENSTSLMLESCHENRSYEEAIKLYDEVLRKDPENADAWVKKAGALQKLGMLNESNKTLYEAMEIIRSNDFPSNWTKRMMPTSKAESQV